MYLKPEQILKNFELNNLGSKLTKFRKNMEFAINRVATHSGNLNQRKSQRNSEYFDFSLKLNQTQEIFNFSKSLSFKFYKSQEKFFWI